MWCFMPYSVLVHLVVHGKLIYNEVVRKLLRLKIVVYFISCKQR